jgi:hypothetical protein
LFSLAGIFLALSDIRSKHLAMDDDLRRLLSDSFSGSFLESRSDDELHRLIEGAMKVGALEKADQISKVALSRVETSHVRSRSD